MDTSSQQHEYKRLSAADVAIGGGEMGALIRDMNWSTTSLGPIESWPQSLRSALSILLPSKAQIALFWGEDLITLYNDAYRPVFGAKHPIALGKPIREAWDELWRAGLKEIFDGVLNTGEAFWAQDRPFFMERHGYLEETYFDVSYDPVRDESGRVGGVFCIVSETTGRVIGARRLRALRDLGHIGQNATKVADVYPAAAEVLARYAEDLPFALLYMPEESTRLTLVARDALTRQVDQMARLLDDLLDLARITHGRVHLRKAPLLLEEAVDAALETSRPMFEAKHHSLEVERPPTPVWVDADRVRLAQIFANLLTNAAKYTDAGGSIVLSIRPSDRRVLIAVTDNGIGLSAEAIPRVFDMFSQASPALERSEGGLGIGLALVKGLVELHGGRVFARSEGIGCGSQFTVELPLAAAPVAQEDLDPGTSSCRATIRNRKILIADDNRDSAQSWATMFELEGCETCTAFSGSEALRLAASFQPDVALLDIGMPGLNGYEVARLLRSSPLGASVLLIAVTGWGQDQDKQAAREAGFDAHLTKPVNLQQVIDLIQAQLRQRATPSPPASGAR